MLILSEAAKDFLQEIQSKEDIYHSYVNALLSFQKFIELDVNIEDIDSYDIACYLDNYFQDGMDLDVVVLELNCIRDFLNWACDKASLEKAFGIMTIKERNSTHPFFSLFNYVMKTKKISGNFVYWAIFVWVSKKTENLIDDDIIKKNILKNRTYSFVAIVEDNNKKNSDLLLMDNYSYYGGPVSYLVSITNEASNENFLCYDDIIALVWNFSKNQETTVDISTIKHKKSSKFTPSNLKNQKNAITPVDSSGVSCIKMPINTENNKSKKESLKKTKKNIVKQDKKTLSKARKSGKINDSTTEAQTFKKNKATNKINKKVIPAQQQKQRKTNTRNTTEKK
ncbi:MAG: hypothetical protein LBF22_03045 [Deltaproteobacteria bacterium]|jgi:hypothetical protein|nr:hypothetical protein [Deltaproteobacteria bacterium]